MPIPAHDPISNVLPPHLGLDGRYMSPSPYRCTATELCVRFGTSVARRGILNGFLDFRSECRSRGIVGFHWLAGSFLDDIEMLENRDPRDIDAVTFIREPELQNEVAAALMLPTNLKNRADTKSKYSVDHIFINLKSSPSGLVQSVCYWYGLYSHRRDQTWKGMLVVDLARGSDDDEARNVLEGKA